ncbi:MAG: homocysteine S-methyltransferase family protein [Ignavibacteriales bacterium]|nr:homocysteine S-methyltransferase family protein [Ignavibacteriales bacterium]
MNNKFISAVQNSKRPLILDGAIGSLLQQKGFKSDPVLWTSYVNFKYPQAIVKIHTEYINAGCDIITTNTFRTNPNSITKANAYLDQEKAVKISVDLALQAAQNSNIFVAGSNAPAEDCYQIERTVTQNELEYNHKTHIDLLYNNGVDFILNETQSHFDEIKIICEHCFNNKIPYIISLFITDDLKILSGENITDILDFIKNFNPIIISFNCISQKTFLKLIDSIDLNFNWGFYLNVGHGNYTDSNIQCGIDEINYSEIVKSSLDLNPKLIGACCGSNSKHISAIKKLFNE